MPDVSSTKNQNNFRERCVLRHCVTFESFSKTVFRRYEVLCALRAFCLAVARLIKRHLSQTKNLKQKRSALAQPQILRTDQSPNILFVLASHKLLELDRNLGECLIKSAKKMNNLKNNATVRSYRL